MTKDEALEKIKELEAYVKLGDNPKVRKGQLWRDSEGILHLVHGVFEKNEWINTLTWDEKYQKIIPHLLNVRLFSKGGDFTLLREITQTNGWGRTFDTSENGSWLLYRLEDILKGY